MASARREYGVALLTGAVGAGLILLAVRQRWAQAVFTPPKPLSPQVIDVSGADLVPLAGALAVAALAGLAAVIATRGVVRRAAGVLLALFGAAAGAAVTASVTAASVVNAAASHVASPGSAAVSGAAGSTTGGTSGGASIVVSDAAGHAIMNGTPWRVAVLAGALLVFCSGLAAATRGPGWPVMSARYEPPRRRAPGADGSGLADGSGPADGSGAESSGAGEAGPSGAGASGAVSAARGAPRSRQNDSASMWESLSVGEDPTDTG